MEWIACSERMPEEGQRVLVADDRPPVSMVVAYGVMARGILPGLAPGSFVWYETWSDEIVWGVTHWMPLPPPPITGTGL